MTSPKLLVPLRVPELGPSLGKLVTGTGASVADLPVDAERIRMVTRLVEAAGEARQLAAKEERGAALAALSSQVWLGAWEEAVSRVTEMLAEQINRRLEEEAHVVRMPRRFRKQLLLDDGEIRTLSARVGGAGAGLIPVLDALDVAAGRLMDATVRERIALDHWQEAIGKAARRLEEAWLRLEERVRDEARTWDGVVTRVSRWRKPLWPVYAVGVPLLAAAVWLGLVMGGYLGAPGWLQRVWELVF